MTPPMSPDDSTNEDLTDRLALLERRTALLEAQLAEAHQSLEQAALAPLLSPSAPADITATEVLHPATPRDLEALAPPPAAPERPAAPGMKEPVNGPAAHPEEVFWALLGLRDRLSKDDDTEGGAVLFTGALWLPTGDYVESQCVRGAAGEFDRDWSEHAAAFGALGHPVRLELLRHVLAGTRTTAALQEAAGITSSGQLHHHLRPLLTAGWLHQAQRGSYEVPAPRIVPLLVCLAALTP